MGTSPPRKLRADAERSEATILAAAERLLRRNPAATMEQIAEEAGVARTTIHRRFSNRDALLEVMAVSAWEQLEAAAVAAHPTTAPPLVALHQGTANVLRIKSGWGFSLANPQAFSPRVLEIAQRVDHLRRTVFQRAQQAGAISPDADIEWVQQVYSAILSETARTAATDSDPDALAARLIHTLLYGAAPR